MKTFTPLDIIFCQIEEDFYNYNHGYININEISQITFLRTIDKNYFTNPLRVFNDCLHKSAEYQASKHEEFKRFQIFISQLYDSDDFCTRIVLLIPRLKKEYIILTKDCSKKFWDQLTIYLNRRYSNEID